MGRVTSQREPLANLDGVGSPTGFGEIQPAGHLDHPLHDLTSLIGDVYKHHRVRIYESELSQDAYNSNQPLFIVDG